MQQCVSSKFTLVVGQGWAGLNCFVVWTVAVSGGRAPIKDHKINLTGGEMIDRTEEINLILTHQSMFTFWKIVYSVLFLWGVEKFNVFNRYLNELTRDRWQISLWRSRLQFIDIRNLTKNPDQTLYFSKQSQDKNIYQSLVYSLTMCCVCDTHTCHLHWGHWSLVCTTLTSKLSLFIR